VEQEAVMTTYFDPLRRQGRSVTGSPGRTDTARLAVDLSREGEHYVVTADVPGVEPRSIEVFLEGRSLLIRAERLLDALEGVRWIAKERPSVTFLRRLELGDDVDRDGVTATCTGGVLRVVVPISERARPRTVPISAAEQGLPGAAAEPLPAGRSRA